MAKITKYPIKNFYVGELYLYKLFAGLSNGETIADGEERIETISTSHAICFQQDEESRYIDWENKREYIGFLTIFYKDGNDYICIHDGKKYRLDGPNIIAGLIPLEELLPQLDTKKVSNISMTHGLELFDILFGKKENSLYLGNEFPVKDFYVGELTLSTTKPIKQSDQRIEYTQLPQNLMLAQAGLGINNYSAKGVEYSVYRCLFLKDIVGLYNPDNNQFYNPNEDKIDNIIPFTEYIKSPGRVDYQTEITIQKARKRFKQRLQG